MAKLFIIFSFIISPTVLLGDSQICRSIRTRFLNEGDGFEPRPCYMCECRNQTLNCEDRKPEECPQPSCDPTLQVSTTDRCCRICPGVGAPTYHRHNCGLNQYTAELNRIMLNTLARCRFNGMSVDDGETFKLDPCGSCDCQNGKLTCSRC